MMDVFRWCKRLDVSPELVTTVRLHLTALFFFLNHRHLCWTQNIARHRKIFFLTANKLLLFLLDQLYLRHCFKICHVTSHTVAHHSVLKGHEHNLHTQPAKEDWYFYLGKMMLVIVINFSTGKSSAYHPRPSKNFWIITQKRHSCLKIYI